jgi:hypothetical protein
MACNGCFRSSRDCSPLVPSRAAVDRSGVPGQCAPIGDSLKGLPRGCWQYAGQNASQSAYPGLQNHQLGNGITPPLRACASSRPPRRTSRDWRLAFGVDGCVLGFELAACGLDDSPLRYAFQWMCGHSAAVATHRAEMLDGRSFRTNAVAITRRTEAGGHSVLEKDPVSCALMSGLLRDACRWPSWVCAYVSGTNLSGGLEAHGC